MRSTPLRLVCAIAFLSYACSGSEPMTGEGGSGGAPPMGEVLQIDPHDLTDVVLGIGNIEDWVVFEPYGATAEVTIERGYRFSAAPFALRDGSCSWGVSESTGEVVISANFENRFGDRFSYARGPSGDTQWGVFEQGTGQQWRSVPVGIEELACADFFGDAFSIDADIARICRAVWLGEAGGDFPEPGATELPRSTGSVELFCTFARESLPNDLVRCEPGSDPCRLYAGCLSFPKNSGLTPILCDGDVVGMCVDGECGEYGCGQLCNDGNPATTDTCQRASTQADWACAHEEP